MMLQRVKINKHLIKSLHSYGLQTSSSFHSPLKIDYCRLSFGHYDQQRYASSSSSKFVQYPYSYAYGVSSANLEYYSIGDALQLSYEQRKLQPAVISGHQQLVKPFGDLNKEVDQLVNAFNSTLGLKKGDVVALWSSNCYEWILVQLACARAGLILCTLNPVYKLPELEYALAKSGAKALFLPGTSSEQTLVNDFAYIAGNLNKKNNPDLEILVQIDGDGLPGTDFQRVTLVELLKSNDGSSTNAPRIDGDDPAIIMFTSGTTGKPKGALLSHSNLVNNAQLTARRLGLDQAGTVAAIPVPLFHIFGLVYGITMMARMGITIALTGYRYNVKSLVKLVNEHQCSHAMIVPAMTIDLINHLEKTNTRIPSLKTIITGSAPTTVETVQRFLKVNPSTENFFIRYGSTETGGCMSMPHPGDKPDKTMDNVGAPLDMTEVKIVDRKTGNVAKIGEQGELYVRGHHVMLGYWKDQAKTKETITDSNWFISGDIATMDKEGYVRLVGRAKELIIRGGENVYPKEIEELLHQHPLILEAFVCGVPDERMGEQVCAWIKLKDTEDAKKLTTEEIRQFCKDKISYFKVPKYVLFVEDFPRTPTGKAQKFMMTEKSIEIFGLSKQ